MSADINHVIAEHMIDLILAPGDQAEYAGTIYIGKPCQDSHRGFACTDRSFDPLDWCDNCREFKARIAETIQ